MDDHVVVLASSCVLVRISSQYVLHIFLFRVHRLYLLRHKVVLCLLVFVKLPFDDFSLHLNVLVIHGNGVHVAHDGLARGSIETDIVIGSSLVLIVVEGPFWDVDWLGYLGPTSFLRLLVLHLRTIHHQVLLLLMRIHIEIDLGLLANWRPRVLLSNRDQHRVAGAFVWYLGAEASMLADDYLRDV